MKRPDKIAFKLMKSPSGVIFQESLKAKSAYSEKIQEAIASDSVIEIAEGDAYLLQQMRKAAGNLTAVRLVFGRLNGKVYIKPITQSDQQKRLVLLLREPRTLSELQGCKLEMDLQSCLARMKNDGTAHIHKDKWVLTEKGMDLLE